MDLLQEIEEKKHLGLLDYKWKVRSHISKIKKHLGQQEMSLLAEVVSPFIYMIDHADQIRRDSSLDLVCQLCTDKDHAYDVEKKDMTLYRLSHLFNDLIESDRALLMCYDCGTVARGVLLQLLKKLRGTSELRPQEIQRIKNDYYMTRYKGCEGIDHLKETMSQLKEDCLFLCAMQLGNDFGHIYVIEKTYIRGSETPRYRIYQSCFDAFLLIDYIELMDYARDLTHGISIKKHLRDMRHLFSTGSWTPNDLNRFIRWFHFTPPSGLSSQDKRLFTYVYLS